MLGYFGSENEDCERRMLCENVQARMCNLSLSRVGRILDIKNKGIS